jgi:hypothetical protein
MVISTTVDSMALVYKSQCTTRHEWFNVLLVGTTSTVT